MLLDQFTEREEEILQLMLEEMSNREIAEHLTVSVETVRWYLKQIYNKLDVHSRKEAIEAAQAFLSQSENEAKEITIKLPAQTTRFLGRDEAMRDLWELFTQGQRLVSIIAPGGMGKSRLSIELGRKIAPHYADGVYFAELAPLNERDSIIKEIASSLDFPFQQDEAQPEQKLMRYLSNKGLLLILDNFEHLLHHSDIVAEILKIAPEINLIVTSRERLNITGETVYTLSGVSVPDDSSHKELADYAAVQLFLDSARRVRPDYKADDSAISAIASICQMVEGMPLALLIAGAWLELLSPEQIRDEIQANIDFLETDARDIPERQRSIRAVFDYTWQRMSDDEQNAFMKLSLFRGGFTAESAQKVASASLRTLLRLMNRALIQRAEYDRYSIHELLRQYGEEKLRDSAEFEVTQGQFITHFVDFLQTRETDVRGHRQLEAMDEIDQDLSNIQQAWHWMVARKDYEALDHSLDCFFTYSLYRAHSEIDDYLAVARSQLEPESNDEIRAVYGRLLVYGHKRNDKDVENIEQGLAIAIHCESQEAIAYANLRMGIYWRHSRQPEKATPYLKQAELMYESLKNWAMLASCYNNLGLIYSVTGNIPQARDYLERSYNLHRDIGNRIGVAATLQVLSYFEFGSGDYDLALEHVQQCLEIRTTLNNQHGIVVTKLLLATLQGVAFEPHEEGIKLIRDAFNIARKIQYDFVMPFGLGAMIYVAISQNNIEEAIGYYEELQQHELSYPLAGQIHRMQALLFLELENYQQARHYIAMALQLDARSRLQGFLFQDFVYIALYLFGTKQYEKALEIVASVTKHFRVHNAWHKHDLGWQEMFEGLTNVLNGATYQAIWQRGLEADVLVLAEELLSEYFNE